MIKNLVDLIEIRNYAANTINALTVDRTIVKQMVSLVPKLDKKIAATLATKEFEEYLNSSLINKVESFATPVEKNNLHTSTDEDFEQSMKMVKENVQLPINNGSRVSFKSKKPKPIQVTESEDSPKEE
jgi:hypothetical protein